MKNANEFSNEYISDLVTAMKTRYAKLQAAISILEMSDSDFRTKHQGNSTAVKANTAKRTIKAKTSSTTASPAPVAQRPVAVTGTPAAASPTTMSDANNRRSLAQKARWERIRAMEAAQSTSPTAA